MKASSLPVFPLGIVSLPGTIQNLQIFEPRYVTMVKECMKNNKGFVMVYQKNESNKDFEINPGDRIAQMIIVPVVQAKFKIVENFKESERGEKGFGSSGLD